MRLWILSVIALTFLFSSLAFAQENQPKFEQTIKFDEFGDVSEKVYASKLNNYFDVLTKDESLQGVVVFYNSFNHNLFKQTYIFEKKIIEKYFKYLSTCFGPQLSVINGGFREEMTTELWFRKIGGKQPEIVNSGYAPPKNLKYLLELLEVENYYIYEAEIVKDVEDNFDDEFLNQRIEAFFTNFAEVLKKDESWRGILIFYADKSEFDIKIIEKHILESLRIGKVDLTKVRIIYGGYKLNPQIESWIIPENGIEPEPMPDEKL